MNTHIAVCKLYKCMSHYFEITYLEVISKVGGQEMAAVISMAFYNVILFTMPVYMNIPCT